MLAQLRKEGGAAEQEEEVEEPDVVFLKVERLEEAEPATGLSIQEGELRAAGIGKSLNGTIRVFGA